MRRLLVLLGVLFCALMAAYGLARYEVVTWMGAVWLHDRWSHKASADCTITWSDSPVSPCNERLALWLYHTGLWTANERQFILYQFDSPAPVADRLERCVHFHIVHIGNRGTTLGLDDGSVYYIAPPDRQHPGRDPEANMRKHGWHDGSNVLVCVYQNKYAHRYYVYKVDGENAIPRRGLATTDRGRRGIPAG